MERAALGAQQTLGQRLPSSDRVRRSVGWDELVWGGGEVVGGCRPRRPAVAHDLSGDSFFEAGGGLRIERTGDGL